MITMDELQVSRHKQATKDATPAQRVFLDTQLGASSHLVAVAILHWEPFKGVDYLVVDNDTPAEAHPQTHGHYGPYVLTWDGMVMDVHRYYNERHNLGLPYLDR